MLTKKERDDLSGSRQWLYQFSGRAPQEESEDGGIGADLHGPQRASNARPDLEAAGAAQTRLRPAGRPSGARER